MSEINFTGLGVDDLKRFAEWSADPKVQQAAKDQIIQDAVDNYLEDSYSREPDETWKDEAREEGIEEGRTEVMDVLEEFLGSGEYFEKRLGKNRIEALLFDMGKQFPTVTCTRINRGS